MAFGSLAVVEEWLDAVNRADGQRLEELTTETVEIVGPRGSGTTERAVLSEWLARAGFSAETLRWFCGADGQVVVEQDARWVDTESGAEQGRARIASQFRVDGARVGRYVRHDAGLSPALASAGLSEADEVRVRGSAEAPNTAPAESGDSTQAAQSTVSTQSAVSAQSTQPAQSAQSAQAAQAAVSAQSEPAAPAEAAESPEPPEPSGVVESEGEAAPDAPA